MSEPTKQYTLNERSNYTRGGVDVPPGTVLDLTAKQANAIRDQVTPVKSGHEGVTHPPAHKQAADRTPTRQPEPKPEPEVAEPVEAEVVEVEPVEVDEPRVVPSKLTVKASKKAIRAAKTVEVVVAIEDAEEARGDGARQSVFDACAARIAKLEE